MESIRVLVRSFCFSILSFRSFTFSIIDYWFICYKVHLVSENGRVNETILGLLVVSGFYLIIYSIYACIYIIIYSTKEIVYGHCDSILRYIVEV